MYTRVCRCSLLLFAMLACNPGLSRDTRGWLWEYQAVGFGWLFGKDACVLCGSVLFCRGALLPKKIARYIRGIARVHCID